MAVRVETQKPCVSKEGNDWRCVGWVPGEGLLLHAVDPKAEKVRAKLGIISEGGGKLKTTVALGNKLDPAFISKAYKVALSSDGRYLAMVGIRKQIGGYLAIWGKDGPKNPVVHQDFDSPTPAPVIFGNDKKIRPQAIAVAPLGTHVVVLTADSTIFIWHCTKKHQEEWAGVWCRLPPDSLLPPAAFDVSFTTSSEFCLTSARLAPATVACDPLQAFQETVTKDAKGQFLACDRYGKVPHSGGDKIQRLCLTLTHRVSVLSNFEKPPPGRYVDLNDGLSEYATPVSEEEAIAQRDIPSMKWDESGTLVALILLLKRSRIIFTVPGASSCHTVDLPTELETPSALAWVSNGLFVACSDRAGRIVLVSRLGTVTKLLNKNEGVPCLSFGCPAGVGSIVSHTTPKGTSLAMSNGNTVLQVAVYSGPELGQIVRERKLPDWIEDPPTAVRLLGSLSWLVNGLDVGVLCSSITGLISKTATSTGSVEAQIVALVNTYKASIKGMWWVVNTLNVTAIPILRELCRHMTGILLKNLCETLIFEAASSDVILSLDTAYHCIGWAENALKEMSAAMLAHATTYSGLEQADWVLKEYWVSLMTYVSNAVRDTKGKDKEGLEILCQAVRTQLKEHQEARLDINVLEPSEMTELHKGHNAFMSGKGDFGVVHYLACNKYECAVTSYMIHQKLSDSIDLVMKLISESTEKWGTRGLLYAPTLLGSTTTSRVAEAMSKLLAGILHNCTIQALPPIFCDSDTQLVTLNSTMVRYSTLSNEAVKQAGAHFAKLTNEKTAELSAELWCASGFPLESLHTAMCAKLSQTAEGIMKLLLWQVRSQDSWSHYFSDITLPCHKGAAKTSAEQFNTYEACRMAVKKQMLSTDTTAKLYMHTAGQDRAVRAGWVCPSCVNSLLSFFLFQNFRSAEPSAAQRILTFGISEEPMRQVAAAHLLKTAYAIITQLPTFSLKVVFTDVPSPVVIMHQVLGGEPKVSDELSKIMMSASPLVVEATNTERAMLAVQHAAKLLAWAIVCLCPSTKDSRGSVEILQVLKRYKRITRKEEGAVGLVKQLRQILRYAWCLQVWHRMHSQLKVETQVLAVPGGIVEAVVEMRGEGALWASKLPTFANDVWPIEMAQGAILSSIELCNDTKRVLECLRKSFYERAEMDTVYTIAQVRKAQYRRIVKELRSEQQEKLPDEQMEYFDMFRSRKVVISPETAVEGLEHLDSEGTTWTHEIDDDFWNFVDNVMNEDLFLQRDGAGSTPREGWKELVVLGRLLASRGDKNETLVLPYGMRTNGEKAIYKGTPSTETPSGGSVAAGPTATATAAAAAPAPAPPAPSPSASQVVDPSPAAEGKTAPSVALIATPSQAPLLRKGSRIDNKSIENGSAPRQNSPSASPLRVTSAASVAPTPAPISTLTKCKAGDHLHLPAVAEVKYMSPSPVAKRTKPKAKRAPFDPTLPYELLPVDHGGLLLDVSLTPTNSTPSSPLLPYHTPKRILSSPVDSPLAVRRALLASPQHSVSRAAVSNAVAALSPSRATRTPRRGVPPSDTATTMTTTDGGTSYSNPATTITATTMTATQAPSSSISVSLPDPVAALERSLTPPRNRREKNRKKDRPKKENNEEARHDNRGVGQVHYHYSETTHAGAGQVGHEAPKATRRKLEKHSHGHDHSSGKQCKKCGKNKKKDRPTLKEMLLNPNEPVQVPSNTVGKTMHRVQAAAEKPNNFGFLTANSRVSMPEPPPPLPQPILLRPQPAPVLPPRTPAPLSDSYALPKPAMQHSSPLVPPLPQATTLAPVASPEPTSLPAPKTPLAARPLESSVVAPQPVDEITKASIALSPMKTPDLEAREGMPTSPLYPAQKKDITNDPMSPEQVELLERQISMKELENRRVMTPAEAAIKTPIAPAPLPATRQTITTPAPEAQPQHASTQDTETLVGQPVLTATEELLYAKYIRHLGITSADAVITGGVPVVTRYEPSVAAGPGDVPGTVNEVNLKHEALQQAEKQQAVAATPLPTPQPVSQVQPVQTPSPVPVTSEEQGKKQAVLEDLITGMLHKQEAAAANTGKEMAAAFTDTLKNLSPHVASALQQATLEGNKMERDGMIKFLQSEGTEMQALARERLYRPEQASAAPAPEPSTGGAGPLGDVEYQRWVERQKIAASKPQTADASVDASERPGIGLQTVLTEMEGKGTQAGAYLAVRDLDEETHWQGDREVHGRDPVTEDLLGEKTEPGRKFLSVQNTHPLDEPFSTVSDTRKWAVQASLARLERDIDTTFERTNNVDTTVREAATAVRSCEAVLRDAQRLRQQRDMSQNIDVLRDEARRIEARLSAEVNKPVHSPKKHSLPASPEPQLVAVQRSPAPQKIALDESPRKQYVSTMNTTSNTTVLPAYKQPMGSHSYQSHLQEMVEEDAFGREPFLWQNTTELPVKRPDRAVPAVLVSSETAPLTKQPQMQMHHAQQAAQRTPAQQSLTSPFQQPIPQRNEVAVYLGEKEVEAEIVGGAALPVGRLNGVGMVYAEHDVEKEVEVATPARTHARVQTPMQSPLNESLRSRGKVSVSRTSKKTSSTSTPLAPVSSRALNTYAQRPRPKQPQRRNKDVPISLQNQIDKLGTLLQDA
eukprot:TRINITY_DN6687_c0_g2_i1.p1 TRINITY_DN6687_c0_g2~~TRINITY_DN6687_c0_g2_i1.p1  ORF type:complete len:2598 (+),score=533.21 TRINITY_DN6687_c0_g2_i1:70-7863(+)